MFGLPETEGLLSGYVYETYPKFLIANGFVLIIFNVLGFKVLLYRMFIDVKYKLELSYIFILSDLYANSFK